MKIEVAGFENIGKVDMLPGKRHVRVRETVFGFKPPLV